MQGANVSTFKLSVGSVTGHLANPVGCEAQNGKGTEGVGGLRSPPNVNTNTNHYHYW